MKEFAQVVSLIRDKRTEAEKAMQKAADLQAAAIQKQETEEAEAAAEAWEKAEAERLQKEKEIWGNKKIPLYVRSAGTETKERIQNFCNAVPGTVEVMKAYGLPIVPDSVIRYTSNTSDLRQAVINSEIAKYVKKNDPYYAEYLKNRINEDLKNYEAFEERSRDRGEMLSSDPKFLSWNEALQTFEPNEGAITEEFTVYAEGQAAYIWECLEDVTSILNEVFADKVPAGFWTIWTVRNDRLELKPEINLRNLCK